MAMTNDDLLGVLRNDAQAECDRVAAAIAALEAAESESAIPVTRIADRAPLPPSATPKEAGRSKRPAKRAARPAQTDRATETTSKFASRPNYENIAIVINEAVAAGKPMRHAVVEHFDVPETTANNWIAKCRSLARLTRPPEPGLGPIGKLPVNEDEARDAAAGPRTTLAPSNPTGFPTRPRPDQKAPSTEPAFSVDDARAHLDSLAAVR